MSDSSSSLRALVSELKRRRVFRVAGVYAVVGWLIIQVAVSTFPHLRLPPWMVTAVIVVVLLGLPIAVVLAWAFEITPEGVKRTEAPGLAAPGAGRGAPGGRRAPVYLGLGAVIALVAFGAYASLGGKGEPGSPAPGTGPATAGPKSIAVLPFDDLGAGEEYRYFADGVHEDVLTHLSRIADLEVISRTSVLRYRETDKGIPEIGRELGVAHILEGSVRRAGNQVRITAQLIDARTDKHLWAETYDRELKDIFAIQSEVARAIASALEAELSPEELERLGRAPTADLTAYDLYLKGRALYNAYSREQNEQAIEHFRRALELDPGFALAHAGLADAYAQRALRFGFAPAWVDSAAAAARAAIERDPGLAEAYKALGLAQLLLGRWDECIATNRRAVERNPNHAPALGNLGLCLAATGRLAEALSDVRRHAELEPTLGLSWALVGSLQLLLGEDVEAEAAGLRAIELSPGDPVGYSRLAHGYLIMGRPDDARRIAARVRAVAPGWPIGLAVAGDIELVAGDLDEARRLYEAMAGSDDAPVSPRLGLVYRRLGMDDRARAVFDRVLGALYTGRSLSSDLEPPAYLRAAIHAVRGEHDEAVRWIHRARDEGWLHYRWARIDPMFESLRGDERFIALLAEIEAEVARQRAAARARG